MLIRYGELVLDKIRQEYINRRYESALELSLEFLSTDSIAKWEGAEVSELAKICQESSAFLKKYLELNKILKLIAQQLNHSRPSEAIEFFLLIDPLEVKEMIFLAKAYKKIGLIKKYEDLRLLISQEAIKTKNISLISEEILSRSGFLRLYFSVLRGDLAEVEVQWKSLKGALSEDELNQVLHECSRRSLYFISISDLYIQILRHKLLYFPERIQGHDLYFIYKLGLEGSLDQFSNDEIKKIIRGAEPKAEAEVLESREHKIEKIEEIRSFKTGLSSKELLILHEKYSELDSVVFIDNLIMAQAHEDALFVINEVSSSGGLELLYRKCHCLIEMGLKHKAVTIASKIILDTEVRDSEKLVFEKLRRKCEAY